MQVGLSRIMVVAVALLAASLAGCGTINEKLTVGTADFVPKWAGGLPADAPPRPGTVEYDAYMKEKERLRSLPAAEREKLENGNASATAPAR